MVGKALDYTGDRAIINKCNLVPSAFFNVPVKRVIAGVDYTSSKPPVERTPRPVEHVVPLFVPMDSFGRFSPKRLRVAEGLSVLLIVEIGHRK